jgi:hypothetical protein
VGYWVKLDVKTDSFPLPVVYFLELITALLPPWYLFYCLKFYVWLKFS